MTAEDATDVYFDDIAGQHTNGTGPNYEIIVQDIIYAYQKFYDIAASSITYTKFYVDLKLTNVDATNNKLSMEMKGEQEAVNA
ncbi:MAG: hypothetical protein MJ200_04420 [Mycoplasmoidaceae bacterium]|nr:hypothetical protein [Mycoplasmoidaceae bacterium]